MRDPNYRIVILSSRQPLNYFLINVLLREFPVSSVVYEKRDGRKKLMLLHRRVKKLGWQRVLGQLLFLIGDIFYIRPMSKRKMGQILQNPGTAVPRVPSTDVEDINSEEVQRLLQDIHPKVVVVAGTSILQSFILAQALTFLNIHTGITPFYRGVHGGFWAIYNKDFGNVGVTIHLVAKGVDTGKIVSQASVRVDPHDTPWTIAAKQYLQGSELMIQAIRDAFQGRLKSFFRTDPPSKQWYHPTIQEYLRWRRILRNLF